MENILAMAGRTRLVVFNTGSAPMLRRPGRKHRYICVGISATDGSQVESMLRSKWLMRFVRAHQAFYVLMGDEKRHKLSYFAQNSHAREEACAKKAEYS